MKPEEFDIIVAGGGIVGLTAALAMAKRHLTVAVIDAGDLQSKNLTKPDSRVFAVNALSKQLFNELEVWERMDQSRISPYQQMHVWDAATGACIDFDARLIANPNLGTIIEESVIKNALFEGIKENKKISLIPFKKITKVKSNLDKVIVFSEEETWESQLLLVTDGGNSPIRDMLGVAITSWPYHQHALVATIQHEKEHAQTAYQVFNSDGPLAFLPLKDEHTCSIVWSTSPKRVAHLMNLCKEDFNQALASAFGDKLGKVNLMSERFKFPLIMRHAKQYVGHNWLLMGDAAHTIHPLAGLGLNVGLADVVSWLNCLDKKKTKTVSINQLKAYQRHRKHAVWQMIALMEGLKMAFANPIPPITALRNIGLTFCNHFTPLKRLFIEHAMSE